MRENELTKVSYEIDQQKFLENHPNWNMSLFDKDVSFEYSKFQEYVILILTILWCDKYEISRKNGFRIKSWENSIRVCCVNHGSVIFL